MKTTNTKIPKIVTPDIALASNNKFNNPDVIQPRYLYWAYGSNMNTRQMIQRCPSAEPVGLLSRTGFKLEFRTYANVAHTGVLTDKVDGVLYCISAVDINALDRFEGVRKDAPAKGSYRRLSFQSKAHGTVYYYRMTAGDVAPSSKQPIEAPYSSYIKLIRDGAATWKVPTSSIDAALAYAVSMTPVWKPAPRAIRPHWLPETRTTTTTTTTTKIKSKKEKLYDLDYIARVRANKAYAQSNQKYDIYDGYEDDAYDDYRQQCYPPPTLEFQTAWEAFIAEEEAQFKELAQCD